MTIRDRTRSACVTSSRPASRGCVAPAYSTSIAQLANSAPGRARSASTWARSLPGRQVSSSSQNAIRSVSSARIPVLRAPASPGVRSLTVTATRSPGGRSGSARS